MRVDLRGRDGRWVGLAAEDQRGHDGIFCSFCNFFIQYLPTSYAWNVINYWRQRENRPWSDLPAV